MKNINENSVENTPCFFHTGRGGRFYNAGHTTFNGFISISEVLAINDNSKNHSFINKENYNTIYKKLESKNLTNLIELLEKCRDNDNYTDFESKTKLSLGADIYTDQNGNELISVAEVETGFGSLDWDGQYDFDKVIPLSDVNEAEAELIIKSNEYIPSEVNEYLQEKFAQLFEEETQETN